MAEETPALTAPTTTPQPEAPVIDLATQPWLYRDDKGNWMGKGAELPENIPGSPEYEVTKITRVRDMNSWLWDKATSVGIYNNDTSMAIFGIPATQLSANSDERTKQVNDAAWGVLKVKIPESEHNAQIVANKLLPFSKLKMEESLLKGVRHPKAFGMSDDELQEFVINPNNKVPTAVASEVIAELTQPGYAEQKRSIGTSLVARIRKSIAPVDNQLEVGRVVSQQGPDYLQGLSIQEQRDAFKAAARFHSTQSTSIMGDGFNAAAVFVQDGVEAIAGFVDAVNPFSGADEYLSQRYRNDPALREKAQQVIVRASAATRRPIERLKEVQRMGNSEALMRTLDAYTNANEPSNQEFLSAIAELQALREDGAFIPGKPFEKLASFGSGVLQSTVNFKHFVSDSTDPNSFLFINEALGDRYTGQTKVAGAGISAVKAAFGAFTDDFWENKSDEEIDAAIKTWSSNYRNINGAHENVVARAYDALGMPNRAKEARTAYGDEKLAEQASMIYDPITLVAGGAGMLGKALGLAGKATLPAEITARGAALVQEGKAILTEIKTVNKSIPKDSINKVIDDVYRSTGRTLTEEEAMLISLSQSGEDMLTVAGKKASEKIRTTINTSGLSDDMVTRINKLNADAISHAAEVKKAMPGMTGPKRVISGFVGNYIVGAPGEVLGKGVRKMGEFMAEGGKERALGKWSLRRLIALQPAQLTSGWTTVAAGGAIGTWSAVQGGDWGYGAGLAIFGIGGMMRPDVLTVAGAKAETYFKVQRRIAKAAFSGERVSGSAIQSALNATRKELGLTQDVAQRAAIESEMNMLNWMSESGFDAAAQAGFHVAIDDVIKGGTVGMTMAWANDQAAAGTGFGIGAAASISMSGLNRVTQTANRFTQKGNEALRGKDVIAESLGILESLQPEQAAKVREWLNGSKDFAEYLRRADSFRRSYDATGGRVFAVTPEEMQIANYTVNADPKDVARIRDEAIAMGMTPTQAAIHAEKSVKEIEAKKQNIVKRDDLQTKVNESERRAKATVGLIQRISGQISVEEANLKAAGKQTSVVLERLKNDLNNENVKLQVYSAEGNQLRAQLSEASRNVDAPITFRKGETRTNAAGNQLTMVREGMYIESGPQARSVYFDISKADAFTVNHEAWEALLHHDAVKSVIPQLNKVLWNSASEGGRMSPAARTAFFDAYAASLTLEAGKRFRDELAAAQKQYESTGVSQPIERFTREAMAWWMATIDSTKPIGYGGVGPNKGLTNVRGSGAFDTLRRIMVGERSLYDVLSTDNVRLQFASMFDPQIGIFPRQYTASMVQSLRESGMRFIKQSDGTVRGFFLNSRGEIVRDPVVNSLYDAIYRMTGGKGSPRLTELNFSEMNHTQQAELLNSAGLPWFTDQSTGTPIPGIDPPKPQGKPTAPTPAPTAGQPTPGTTTINTYNGQPIVPGVYPPPAGTPAPAPTGTATPAPATPAPTAPAPTPVTPTPKPATQTPAGTPIPPPPPAPVQPAAPTPTAPAPTPTTVPIQPVAPAPTTPVPSPVVNPSTLPPVGVVIGGHAQVVLDTLTNVPESQRGLTFTNDKAGPKGGVKTAIWGKPTAAEINALANSQGLPDTIRNNMVMMAQIMAQGGERPIITGRYVNLFSHGKDTHSEGRYYMKDGFQYVSDRVFVPLYFETQVQYWHNTEPNRVISESEYEKLSPTKKGLYTPRNNLTTKVFNVTAFHDNKNIIFSEGVRVYNEDGSFTYLKDVNGRELNPTTIRELFNDDKEFYTMANEWMQRYNSGEPISPSTLQAPASAIIEPSAISLGRGDRARGEARLTVLRAAHGMTVRNGRVVVNPTTFTNQAVRGLAFPYENLSVSSMGELSQTGTTTQMSQTATIYGQFNMAPGAWSLRSKEVIAGLRANFLKVNPANTLTASYVHPNIPNTYIHEFNGRAYDIYVDGENIPNNARNIEEAQKASIDAILEAQNMADARQYAEKVIKDEAARVAREKALNDATEEAARKKVEKERTRAEAALLKETQAQQKEWLKQAEAQAKADADALAVHEKEQQRIEKEKAKYEAAFQRLVDQDAKNQARIDKKNQIAEQRRIEAEQRRIDADKKKYDDDWNRLLEEERKNKEAAEKLREKQKLEQERRDNEAKLQAEQLRRDIETRAKEREVEDANALATALRSNTPELDIGNILRGSLKVDPAGLPVTGDNRLVVRRILDRKPIVTQTLNAQQQTGPLVQQAEGNARVALALGSPEARAAAPDLNKYLNREMRAGQEVMRAINDVWKTELGNQLHAVYQGLDNYGKPRYVYRLYGVNGQELYRTENAVAMYNNMLVQEQRLRGQTTSKAPKTKEEAETLQGEVMRQMTPNTYLQSQKTTIQRQAESETANRYRNK